MAVVLVVIVAASIATSTARFSTLISNDSTSKGAKWWFKVNEYDAYSNSQFTIDLASTAVVNANIKNDSVAPSSVGEFSLLIDCTNCQVDVVWEISFAFKEDAITYPNIIFWIGTPGESDYQEIIIGTTKLTGNITFNPENQTTQSENVVVNWRWPVDTSLDETEFSGQNYEYICTITASQDIT